MGRNDSDDRWARERGGNPAVRDRHPIEHLSIWIVTASTLPSMLVSMSTRQVVRWTLLTTLGAAAILGLVIVFAGETNDVVSRMLFSVLLIAAALIITLPAALAGRRVVVGGMGALAACEVVLVLLLIWSDGQVGGEPLNRASGMLAVALVFGAIVFIVAWLSRESPPLLLRAVAVASHVTGTILLIIAWLLILSDGEIDIPGRVAAGLAIIYAAATLAAVIMGMLDRWTIVRR